MMNAVIVTLFKFYIIVSIICLLLIFMMKDFIFIWFWVSSSTPDYEMLMGVAVRIGLRVICADPDKLIPMFIYQHFIPFVMFWTSYVVIMLPSKIW